MARPVPILSAHLLRETYTRDTPLMVSVSLVTAFLTANAAALLESLVASETADRLALIVQSGSLAVVPALKCAALNDVQDALRAFYAAATRNDAIMVGDYLNSLTDAQLRTLFSMTAAQVTTLRTNKLAPAASLASSIRAATGA